LIRDTLIFKTLLAPMRYGVTLTILIDSCDTGMILDLPYSWTTKTDRPGSLAKLSMNEDFSFVRFLKVVKTLYEASTFTQLGRTVGSALRNPAGDVEEHTDYEEETFDATSRGTTPQDTETKRVSKKTSLLDALTSCTSPDNANDGIKDSGRSKGRRHNDMSTVDTRETRPAPQNFLEQVMNCTLGHADEESDEDTYAPRHDDSYDAETTTTFETMTDDGYESPRGRRGRNRSRH